MDQTSGAQPSDRPLGRPREGRKRSHSTQEAILTAAAELAGEQGYIGANLEAVAARAGAGKQTIYRWWGSKARLYMDVYERLVPLDGLTVEAGSPRATLLARLTRLFWIYRETPAGRILAGLIVEAQGDPRLSQAFRRRFIGQRSDILRRPLAEAKAAGLLPADHDSALTTDLILGAIWYRLLVGDGPLDTAFAEGLLQRLLGDMA